MKRHVSQYVDTVCNDKPKILRKLRKINYNRFFGNQFEVASIDENFEGSQNQEKVKIIRNVIDLFNYNQAELLKDESSLKEKAAELNRQRSKKELEDKRLKALGIKKLSKYEESIANDPKRISKYNVFFSNMSYAKLKKKNINVSPSIAYQRPETKILGGDLKIKKGGGDTRAKSTLR